MELKNRGKGRNKPLTSVEIYNTSYLPVCFLSVSVPLW